MNLRQIKTAVALLLLALMTCFVTASDAIATAEANTAHNSLFEISCKSESFKVKMTSDWNGDLRSPAHFEVTYADGTVKKIISDVVINQGSHGTEIQDAASYNESLTQPSAQALDEKKAFAFQYSETHFDQHEVEHFIVIDGQRTNLDCSLD